jgi:carbon storage regulator
MLVLTRKLGETVVIDGGIKVTVLEVAGNRVRLGIAAPDGVRILRGELAGWHDAYPAAEPCQEMQALRK